MATYILSNGNRFYAALETTYGIAAAITQANRFQASRFQARQVVEKSKRLDKTGTRTYQGQSPRGRRRTAFEIRTYLSPWDGNEQPAYGPLFQAALGADPQRNESLTVDSSPNSTNIRTTTPHGQLLGAGVSSGTEIRFVVGYKTPPP